MSVSATFLLFEGFSNMVLSCLLEPLRAVRDQSHADVTWRLLTLDNGPVRSSSEIFTSPTADLDEVPASDLLVIVSGYGFRQHANPENCRLIMSLARKNKIVVGADTGSWLMAATGLFDEKPVTLHWSAMAEFAEAFPHLHITSDNYVMDGRFWSCGGASTALELMLSYISDKFGNDKALLASGMFLQAVSQTHADRVIRSTLEGVGSERLREVTNVMSRNIETPLTLAMLADAAGMSSRTLNRLFKAELGMSPGQYYQNMRLAQAKDLALNTDFGLREIALRCGYADAAALSKAFSKFFGQSVRRLRAQSS